MTAPKRGPRRPGTSSRVTPKGTRPAAKKGHTAPEGPTGTPLPARPPGSTGPVRGHARPAAIPVRRTGNRGGR